MADAAVGDRQVAAPPAERAPAGWVSGVATVGRLLLPFVLLVVVWHVTATLSGLSSYFYPKPTDVWDELISLIRKGILPAYIADSLWRWGLGVALGVAISVGLALVFALSETLNEAFMPLVNFFNAIAELAWLPLFVLWFGYGFETILLSIVYVVLFPVLYNTMLGLRSVPPITIQAVRTLGANRLQVVWEALLPGALPNLVTGVRVGASFAFRALVGAEIIAASSGLGYMIFESRENQLTQRTIVGMIVIGVLWLAIDRLYLRPIEAATVERWGLVHRAG